MEWVEIQWDSGSLGCLYLHNTVHIDLVLARPTRAEDLTSVPSIRPVTGWKVKRIISTSHKFLDTRNIVIIPLIFEQKGLTVEKCIQIKGCNVGWFQWTIFWYFLDYYFLLCCCYMWPSARCGNYISPFLCANSIWKSFLKYEWCPWNCKLQFHGHHSYFRKDFQMLLTLKEGHT